MSILYIGFCVLMGDKLHQDHLDVRILRLINMIQLDVIILILITR